MINWSVVGVVVGLVSILVTIFVSWTDLKNRFKAVVTAAEHNRRAYLNNFSSELIDPHKEAAELDAAANAILGGAGPATWRLPDGQELSKGRVFFVDVWKWVQPVFPDGRKKNDLDATCGIEPGGTLTILGFSEARSLALVKYGKEGNTAGTPCDTGTFLFYPVPPL